jgi:hypothetical protein
MFTARIVQGRRIGREEIELIGERPVPTRK